METILDDGGPDFRGYRVRQGNTACLNISASSIAETMGVTTRAIEKNIKKLRESGILIRHGAARGGYWEIKKNK